MVVKKGKMISYTICPVDVPSQHADGEIIIDSNATDNLINNMKGKPIFYDNEDGNLFPRTHGNSDDRIEIGKNIGGGTIKDENGTDWVVLNAIIDDELHADKYEKMLNNQDKVGFSMEAMPIGKNNKVLDFSSAKGVAIIEDGYQAWDTGLLVAEKGEAKDSVKENVNELSHDESVIQNSDISGVVKDVLTNIYTPQLENKDMKIEELNIQIEKLTQTLNDMNESNKELMNINEQFMKYMK